MKLTADRPFANPEAAACKLVDLANRARLAQAARERNLCEDAASPFGSSGSPREIRRSKKARLHAQKRAELGAHQN
jgi:hypothetical protein